MSTDIIEKEKINELWLMDEKIKGKRIWVVDDESDAFRSVSQSGQLTSCVICIIAHISNSNIYKVLISNLHSAVTKLSELQDL
jgi:hypothetical protein